MRAVETNQLDQGETPADGTEGGDGVHRLITMFWIEQRRLLRREAAAGTGRRGVIMREELGDHRQVGEGVILGIGLQGGARRVTCGIRLGGAGIHLGTLADEEPR